MRLRIVRATVPPKGRERYLRAWTEWTGTLFTMGIRAELYESADAPGTFTEITWFEPGEEAALADDRLARIDAELEAGAGERGGAGDLHRSVSS
ncbi:MAG: hypothetical protein RRA92_08570 [Gemmatimonadota bacterium]|nr:hypothetical protein [Gemmatimonadota bacterium]